MRPPWCHADCLQGPGPCFVESEGLLLLLSRSSSSDSVRPWTRQFQVPPRCKILWFGVKSHPSPNLHGSVDKRAIWVEKGPSWWQRLEMNQRPHSSESQKEFWHPKPCAGITDHCGQKRQLRLQTPSLTGNSLALGWLTVLLLPLCLYPPPPPPHHFSCSTLPWQLRRYGTGSLKSAFSHIYSSDHTSFPKGLPDAYRRRLWSENNETKASEEKKIKSALLSGQLVRCDASFSVDEDKEKMGHFGLTGLKMSHTIVTREARFPDSKLATGCEPQPWAAVP